MLWEDKEMNSHLQQQQLHFPLRVQGFPHENHRKQMQPPQSPGSVGLRWAWRCAFPEMGLMGQWTHFENHCFRALLVSWTGKRNLPYSPLPCVAMRHVVPLQSHLHFLWSQSSHLSPAVVSTSFISFYYYWSIVPGWGRMHDALHYVKRIRSLIPWWYRPAVLSTNLPTVPAFTQHSIFS